MHNRWLTSTLFVLKRVASLLVSLFLASIIIFLVLRLLPGDSSASLGVGATQDQLEQLRKELGDAAHPLHYLAIPPDLFGTVVQALHDSGCAKGARVVVELGD